MLEGIKEKLDAGTPVEETCAVTELFGKDSRGRVRAVGHVSRMQVELSALAHAKLDELKYKDGVLTNKVEDLGGKMGVLIEGFKTLCYTVKDIQDAMPSVVGSNMCSTSRGQNCEQGHDGTSQSGSVAYTSSPSHVIPPDTHTSSPSHAISPARSAVGDIQQCSVLNMEGDIGSTSKVCTGVSALMDHGSPVPATHLKVLLDNILLPDEKTVKANTFAPTFRDVGIGGFVVHPKRSIAYD